jgi:hypothetical protein
MRQRCEAKEKGQVLVLLVFGAVALLGFAALAIDGGMLYSDRRHAQNAADASSLGGGTLASLRLENSGITLENFSCGDSAVVQAQTVAKHAAVNRAASNGFTIDNHLNNDNGVTTVCVDNNWNGAYHDKYIDVRVRITFKTDTAFAHFVYPGEMKNTVEAVTRVRPQAPLAFGQAIVSLNQSVCDGNQHGVIISGSAEININGGGVFSNGCLRHSGATNLVINVSSGSISYVGQYIESGNVVTNQPIQQVAGGELPEIATYVPPPDCSQVPNFGSPSTAYQTNASGTIPPGNYNRIRMNGPVQLVGGGLYCLYGNFEAGNNDLSIDTSNGKQGVTIYLEKGNFETNGGGTVILSAPPRVPDPSPAIGGVLIYLAEGNTGIVKLRGNSTSSYWGIVYAPSGTIDAAGTSGHDATFNTQLVGKNVYISGNARIDINYSGGSYYRKPTMMDLYK